MKKLILAGICLAFLVGCTFHSKLARDGFIVSLQLQQDTE